MISLSFNIILAQIFLFAARVVEARGLVPCGGTDEPQCQACYLVQMGQSIITFLVSVTMSIVIVMFAVGGFKLLTSAGNPGNVQKGKDIMWNSIIGFIIVLTGFLIIDTIMKAFVDQEVLSPWSQIQCTNPVATTENNGGTLTNTTGQNTVSGTSSGAGANTSIANAVDGMGNFSTADAPGTNGGRSACAYAVNQVLSEAGIAPLDGNSVVQMEAALQGGRGTLVNQSSAQAGDIVIVTSSSGNHTGICLNDGCSQVKSNSSSNATFSWVSDSSFSPSYSAGPGRIYRVTS